jgi:hypothetical protein
LPEKLHGTPFIKKRVVAGAPRDLDLGDEAHQIFPNAKGNRITPGHWPESCWKDALSTAEILRTFCEDTAVA